MSKWFDIIICSNVFDYLVGGIVILGFSMMVIASNDNIRREDEFRTKCSELNGVMIKQSDTKFLCLSSEVVIG